METLLFLLCILQMKADFGIPLWIYQTEQLFAQYVHENQNVVWGCLVLISLKFNASIITVNKNL